MRGSYPGEMRMQVIGLVEGGASRREAAEQLEVSASSAVRWVQRWRADGTSGPKPRGGSTSPLEPHAEWILTLVAEQSDLTLDEIVSAMHKKRIGGSRTALWRFFARHGITVKKKLARGGTAASRRGSGASTLDS
jgi:transposase